MNSLPFARLIANISLFFELCDDETLDPDVANDVMERLVYDLKSMDHESLRGLIDAFGVIASEYEGEQAQFVRDIPYAFLLKETLAADDPQKLAELDAQRDARIQSNNAGE